ncbi:MAG: TMEM175 family protein [Alphaproteobacteria bacterium]|nr:TMEM175 family protein [Alphaproteobacteria bacterium]
MNKSRLEAFSDALFAVIITIMVLELKAPENYTLAALRPLMPIFLSYVLSFVYGAVFWINHHYLLTATRRISNGVLWANLNFLFWLSLIPFFTAWVDENHFHSVPVAAYGMVLFMVFVSYRVLELILLRIHDADAPIVRALCHGGREKASVLIIFVAILLSFVHPMISMGIYVGLAAWWIIPTRAMRCAVTDLNMIPASTRKEKR